MCNERFIVKRGECTVQNDGLAWLETAKSKALLPSRYSGRQRSPRQL